LTERTKIDYGIYLGIENSSIARMENGEAVVIKISHLKDEIDRIISQ